MPVSEAQRRVLAVIAHFGRRGIAAYVWQPRVLSTTIKKLTTLGLVRSAKGKRFYITPSGRRALGKPNHEEGK